MIAEYQKKTNIGVGIGIAVWLVGVILQQQGGATATVGWILTLAGGAVFIWGCFMYATGKGHNPAFGLLGLLGLIGLIILAVMPDKTKGASAPPTPPPPPPSAAA